MMLPYIYRGRNRAVLHGLKVWPDDSPLVRLAQNAWEAHKQKTLHEEGLLMSGWFIHIKPFNHMGHPTL